MDPILSTLKIELLAASHSVLDRRWHAVDQQQPYSRLYFLVDGACEVDHHRRVWRLEPGYLHVIPAHTPMAYRCPDTMTIYWAHFQAEIFGGLDLLTCLGCDLHLPVGDLDGIAERFERLIALYPPRELASQAEATGLLLQLLAPLLGTVQADRLHHRQHAVARFQRVLSAIDERLGEPLRVPDLARLAHLESSYFSTLFTEVFGVPPLRYIHRRRTERAMRLLWETDRTLDAIAAELGYADASHFSRTFKRLTGLAPARFRDSRLRP